MALCYVCSKVFSYYIYSDCGEICNQIVVIIWNVRRMNFMFWSLFWLIINTTIIFEEQDLLCLTWHQLSFQSPNQVLCRGRSNWLHNTLFNVSSCVQKCGCQMSACWPLVSVGVLQRDCVTLHYSTSNSDALSSVSRACARNTQNYIRPQAVVDKISYISRLSIQNMFAAIQDFQKCYLYFVVCCNYKCV